MKVTIFGASGATGRQLVDQALAGGHQVTTFVRDAGRLPVSHPALRIVTGDVMVAASVVPVVDGADAVLCALGNMPAVKADRDRAQPKVPVCSVGTGHIIEAMRARGVARLVVLSSASVGESRKTGRLGAAWVVRRLLPDVMNDKEAQEARVRASGLAWTILRPTVLTEGPRTNAVRLGPDVRWSLLSKISRADVAAVMLALVADTSTIGTAVTVTSG